MNRSGLMLYTRGISVLGAAMIVSSSAALVHTPNPVQWLLFSAIVLLAGRFTLSIASIEASISVSDTFFIAAALLFGAGPAMITLAVDGCLLSLWKRQNRDHVIFNTFSPALSLGIATHAFFFLTQAPPLAERQVDLMPLVLPLVVLTVIYFALNSGLTAVAVGLESGRPPQLIWREHLAALAWSYFAAGSTALCLVLIVKQIGLLAFPIIAPILAAFHLTLRTSFVRLQESERHLADMDRLYVATIETLAMAMDAKDTVTHSHVRRVQTLAIALADALRVTDVPTLRALRTAALLHDTGKLGVPERILNKPGKLTATEFEQMKRHVTIGADILSLVPFPYPVVPIVRCHHENWDGSGYPGGIAGEDIPIGARILSVVDCYDALTSDRPYRVRFTDEAAIAIVKERRGTMYDPQVVDAFAAIEPGVRLAETPEDGHDQVLSQLRSSHVAGPGAWDGEHEDMSQVARDEAVSIATRQMACEQCVTVADVLAISTRAVHQIAPEATGAWFIPDTHGAQLDATAPFGSRAASLTGLSIRVGERLTGWVAVHRQLMLNSEAALDLGAAAFADGRRLAQSLSVAVADGETLAAVLTIYSGERQPFTDDQGHRLEQLAPYVAKAITRASANVPTTS